MLSNFKKEPSLSELLDDPLVALLMASDGVTRTEVESLMAGMRLKPVGYEFQRKKFARSQDKRIESHFML